MQNQLIFEKLKDERCFRNNTASSSPVTRVASYVLPVILFSALLNIPKFFETELVRSSDKSKIEMV